MNIKRATLIKLATDDGLIDCKGHVELGKTYLVDKDEIRSQALFNTEKLIEHEKEIVTVVDENHKDIGWFATELLKIDL